MGTFIAILKFIPSLLSLGLKIIPYKMTKKNYDRESNRKRAYDIARDHARDILRITRTTIQVTGEENIPSGMPKVFMGNHQSYFDVLVEIVAIKERIIFIAKKELQDWPIYSFWMREMGCLFLDRQDPRAAVKLFNEAAEIMAKDGVSALIYPEGTRSRKREIAEYQKGSFKLPDKAGCPIVPMVIQGAYKVLEEENRIRVNETVHLKYMPPIFLDQLSKEEVKRINVTLRDEMQDEVDRIFAQAGSQKNPARKDRPENQGNT